MNDEQLRQAYARHLTERKPAGRDGCPSPEMLLAVVERQGDEASRLATLDHAMACDACRRDLELLRTVAVAEAGNLPVREVSRTFSLTSWPGRLAAAAVIVVAVGGLLLMPAPDGSVLRGDDSVVLVSPRGDVAGAVSTLLTWRGTAGAVGYDVQVLSAAGDSVFAMTTTDTTVTFPWDPTISGGEFIWSVRARFADGRQATSLPLRFRIRQP